MTRFSDAYEWELLSHFVVRSPGFPFSLLRDFQCLETQRALETMAGRFTKSLAEATGLRELFATECERGRAALERVVATDAFKEAIFLSSPDLYENNLGKYERAIAAGKRTSDIRRIERRLFSYLQRFVAKNETTSTFGPLNYGSVDPKAKHRGIEVTYAEGPLIKKRTTFLAYWAVKALADAIARDLAEHLPLRKAPWVEITAPGRLRLHHAGGKETRVPLAFTTILESLPKKKIVDDAFRAAIPTLLRAGILERSLDVPSTELHLLDRLQEAVDALPPSIWQARLRQWKRFTEAFAVAPLSERRVLLESAEKEFTAQTGLPARRGSGVMYADRLIIYEEALGNVARCAFSAEAHDRIRRQLRGALEVAAAQGEHEWRHLRALGATLFDELSPDGRGIPFATFIAEVQKRMPEMPAIPSSAIEEALLQRVRAGETNIASRELPVDEVERELYALPDVFVSSASEADLLADRFEIFLGKLHHHLLVPGWLTTFHPDERGLRAELAEVLADGSFAMLAALEVKRRNKGFYDFPGPRIEFAERATSAHERLSIHALVVVRDRNGEIGLQDKNGRPFVLYLTLADHLRYPPFAMFTLPWLAPTPIAIGAHTPRISIDGVVVQRARWVADATEITASKTKDELERFIAIDRWRRERGLPDRVYVKGSERKPVFVDFAIPQCHALLASLAENATTLHIEEMFPGPEALWLNQGLGGFTCELRMNVLKRRLGTGMGAQEAAE